MTNEKRIQLLDKNNKIIDMVIEKAKNYFPDDIALIGLTGSFSTGDYHEKSDLDLIIVNTTPRGWEIAYCFIFDDVGYDIYCTPWSPRIEAQSRLESPMVSCLLDLDVLYCAKPEYMEKLQAYRQNALDILALPIGKDCLERARKDLNLARQAFAEILLSDDAGTVRYASGTVVYNLVNALTNMNNTYIKRGIKRYLDSVLSYRYIPDHFEALYMAAINAESVDDIRHSTKALLQSVMNLHTNMIDEFTAKPHPTYENLQGTYEELWCNCRNKIIESVELGDQSYAFHAGCGAQNYLDEMNRTIGTPKYDLMRYFAPHNLPAFKEAFLSIMADYLDEYKKAGRTVEHFDTFEDLYQQFMSR
ncbi:MAG: nucleotidyltransferase domain-containing protein [Oscillospiraceae bacterium]|nr:nucleotidyltransferase domain-containing protein [Oscillospiraceae bacterium]